MEGNSSKLTSNNKSQTRKSKFDVNNTMVTLCESIHNEIYDKKDILKEFDEVNKNLEVELKQRKENHECLIKNASLVYNYLDSLYEEVKQVSAEIEVQDIVLKHKDNTIKHQKGIIALVTENLEKNQERHDRMTGELQNINEEDYENMEKEYSQLIDEFDAQVRLILRSDQQLEQENPLQISLEAAIAQLQATIVRETRIQLQMDEALEEKVRDYCFLENKLPVLHFKVQQVNQKLRELTEVVLPELKKIVKKIKRQNEQLMEKKKTLEHQMILRNMVETDEDMRKTSSQQHRRRRCQGKSLQNKNRTQILFSTDDVVSDMKFPSESTIKAIQLSRTTAKIKSQTKKLDKWNPRHKTLGVDSRADGMDTELCKHIERCFEEFEEKSKELNKLTMKSLERAKSHRRCESNISMGARH